VYGRTVRRVVTGLLGVTTLLVVVTARLVGVVTAAAPFGTWAGAAWAKAELDNVPTAMTERTVAAAVRITDRRENHIPKCPPDPQAPVIMS
jgi:hypothetical protein